MSHRTTSTVLVILVGLAMVGLVVNGAAEREAAQRSATDQIDVAPDLRVDPASAPADALNYSATVTVTIDGSPAVAGEDYRWSAANGTLLWLNSTQVQDGQDASVEYEYGVLEGTTSDIAALFQAAAVPVGLLGLVAVFGLVNRQFDLI